MCIWTGVQHVIVEPSAEPVMPTSVTALLDKIRALEALVQSLEGKNGALESALVQHAL
jgi:hypothetical protein